MKLRFTSRAYRDVDETTGFYRQKSLRVAGEFLLAIDGAGIAIKADPLACPKVSTALRRHVMNRFPYGLYYRVTPDEIIVVAVMHAKRDPRVWRDRE